MRVVAALSGGVDSAVAAALAVEAGHDVVGVHLALASEPAPTPGFSTRSSLGGSDTVAPPGRSRGCCTLADRNDAARAADVLGIPFYVWDFAAEFDRDVVADFVTEYAAGRTPNPCVRCNQRIKFAAMLDRAVALGFDAICTGHYARLTADGGATGTRSTRLHRGVDSAKDQSYVLAVLTPDQLVKSIFPLGEWAKPQVRAEAARRGLLVADKPDSSDICFIPSGDTGQWLTARLGTRSGPIVDAVTGERLGTHSGTALTVGQRRGLRLTVPAADGQPRYVVSTNPATREVLVGPAHLLDVAEILTESPVWCGPTPAVSFTCTVQVRAHGEAVEALVTSVRADGAAAASGMPAHGSELSPEPTKSPPPSPEPAGVAPGQLLVELRSPVRGIAPGQTLVMYDGTRVIGSATIVRATSPR